jgi:hypothetical protein
MQNAGTHIGEHSARAYLWAQQGEYGEMTLDLLYATQSSTEGINAGLSVGIPVAGALESRATSATTTVLKNESIVIDEGASSSRVSSNQSQVGLPNAGESAMNYGTRVHQDLPRIVGETNPGAAGTYNVRPGLTGPDLANPTGMNANYAEMKSLWDQQSRIVSQARAWGFDAQSGRYFFYDRNTGTVFEGIIQTEKFPSGRFRP